MDRFRIRFCSCLYFKYIFDSTSFGQYLNPYSEYNFMKAFMLIAISDL